MAWDGQAAALRLVLVICGMAVTIPPCHPDGIEVTDFYGNEAIWRANKDTYPRVTLPNPGEVVRRDGVITLFSVQTTTSGDVHVQVWRKMPGSSTLNPKFELKDAAKYYAKHSGHHTVLMGLKYGLNVSAGDVIGFYSSKVGMVPWSDQNCNHDTIRSVRISRVTSSTILRHVGVKLFFYKLRRGGTKDWCRKYSLKVHVASKEEEEPFTNGFALFNKGKLDSLEKSNMIHIPNVRDTFKNNGSLLMWKIYARRFGTVHLQIWRRITGFSYQLIWQMPYHVTSFGKHLILPANQTSLRSGDVLGLYFPRRGVIPYKSQRYAGCRWKSLRLQPQTAVTPGQNLTFLEQKRGRCRRYAINLQLSKPNETLHYLGHDVQMRPYVDVGTNRIIIPEPRNPLRSGRLFGWRLYAAASGKIHLQIWRPTRYEGRFRLAAQTPYEVKKPGVHIIPLTSSETRLQDGDLLGFYHPGKSVVPFDGSVCADTRYRLYLAPRRCDVGDAFFFQEKSPVWSRCKRYSISVLVLANQTTTDDVRETSMQPQTTWPATTQGVTTAKTTET